MEALDYWRLCDELTIHQAALLIAGVDPAGYTNVEKLIPRERPMGFDAAKHAITNALRRGVIEGTIQECADYDPDGHPNGIIPESIDPEMSRVQVDALRAWLATSGISEASGKSPKQTLLKWLRENAASLGMTDEEGVVNETGIEEIAKVANWQLTGGAPRTPGS